MNKDAIRKRLEQERERLKGVRAALLAEGLEGSQQDTTGELSTFDQHQADIGTETFERAKDISILHNVDAELADVDWALERLSTDDYGICEACGKPIGEARLRARPAARFCVEDQARAEREASAP